MIEIECVALLYNLHHDKCILQRFAKFYPTPTRVSLDLTKLSPPVGRDVDVKFTSAFML